MSRTLTAARTLVGGLGAWLVRTLAWLTITAALTLGGASLLMLFKDWTLQSIFTSMILERAVDRFGVYATACACWDPWLLRSSPAGWTLLRPPWHAPRAVQLRYNSLE